MKQNNRDCKIVQDLLPNYIENLTDEVTNEFIEEHIAKCPECAQVLKDMNGEIKLEQINQDKEIKYLKAIRRRVKRTIAIVSLLIIIIATCVVGYVYNKSQIQVNNYTFLRASYVVENQEGTKDGNLYGTLIAVIDENGICKSVRGVEEGYKEGSLQEQMKLIGRYADFYTNVMIINNELHYNTNIWNGLTKEELKKYWDENYTIDKLEEI
ncbi:MAG: zf-HC2 domain-containing protein [Clostridia bacterium]|nr:zf-HC2 domain-containing protein [Clostridia bacterium]